MEHKPFRPETRTVRRSGAPAVREFRADVCVAGAGISGVSAAIEAARLGKRVVLIDGLPSLGGQAVNSIIGMIVGLFGNGPNGKQLTHGMADDILRDLGASGDLEVRMGGVSPNAFYNEVALGRWVERKILELKITPLLGAVLRRVTMDDRRVAELQIATRYGDVVVQADWFIDATGDAALVWLAGLECREPAEGIIYGSQMMVIENFEDEHRPSRDEVAARLRDRAEQYGLTRRDGFAMNLPGGRTAVVNMTHIENPLDPFEAAWKGIEGKEQADRALSFLKAEFPEAFGRARVRAYGLPGMRQTRWIVGCHHLTVEEVRRGVKFEDSIARTAWPLEQHHHAEGYVWEPFAEDHVHYVPLRSLTPPGADNIVAAGRCIDGDAAALSSVRVMGPCIAMGAAAAHALDLAGRGSVHQINLAALRERIRANIEE
ncbi:MAG TPA: FAD-dependent oxidoreductase [Bryobacteraceae bacterium]|nr:FAD-dependent oxidoreductase [Bryobacteraceae bacterium]